MYEHGTLRPPTPLEMKRRRVPLETLRVWWTHRFDQKRDEVPASGCVEECDAEPTVAQLAEFMKDYSIPMGAELRTGVFGIVLHWTHLELCEVCKCWREEHDEDDMLHKLMLRSADSWRKRSGRCELCERDVIDLERRVQMPWHLEKVAAMGALFTGETL